MCFSEKSIKFGLLISQIRMANLKCGQSAVIRCDGFLAIVIDSHMPTNWMTLEFLQTVDVIIFLQWDAEASRTLTDVLTLLKDGLFSKGSWLNLKCLIVPRHFGSSPRASQSNPAKSNGPDQSRSIACALRLGISVLQLSPTCASGQRYNQLTSHSDQTCIIKNKNHEVRSLCGRQLGTNLIQMKRTVLYHKLGVGTLSLVPVFTKPNDISQPTSSFCALLAWQPVGWGKPNVSATNRSPPTRYILISSSGHRQSAMPNPGRPHLASAIKQESSPGYWPIKSTDREERAIKQLRSFIRQLSSHVSPIRVTQTQPSKSGSTSNHLRTGLSQSCTYTSGFALTRSTNQEDAVSFGHFDPHTPNKFAVDSRLQRNSVAQDLAHLPVNVESTVNSPSSKYAMQSTLTQEICNGNSHHLQLNDATSRAKPVQPKGFDLDNSEQLDVETEYRNSTSPSPSRPDYANNQFDTLNVNNNKNNTNTNNDNDNLHQPSDRANLIGGPERIRTTQDGRVQLESYSKSDFNDKIPKSPSCPNTMDLDRVTSHRNHSVYLPRPETIWSDTGPVAFSATVLLAIPESGEADYYAESPQYLTVADLRAMGLYDGSDDSDDSDDDNDDGGDGEEITDEVEHGPEEIAEEELQFTHTGEADRMNQDDKSNGFVVDVCNGTRSREQMIASEHVDVPNRLYRETLSDINSFTLFNGTGKIIDRIPEKLDAPC